MGTYLCPISNSSQSPIVDPLIDSTSPSTLGSHRARRVALAEYTKNYKRECYNKCYNNGVEANGCLADTSRQGLSVPNPIFPTRADIGLQELTLDCKELKLDCKGVAAAM